MIYLLLADGFEECEALVPLDMLRRAGLTVKTVALDGKKATGTHGITVSADLTATEATETPALVILPGGMPGAANLDRSAFVDGLLTRTLREGGRVAAICAAPLVLGHRGLLNGRRAVCFPGFEKELFGATVAQGERVVTDGPFTTAVGMGAAYEFALALVSLLLGTEKAKEVGKNALLPDGITV